MRSFLSDHDLQMRDLLRLRVNHAFEVALLALFFSVISLAVTLYRTVS